MATIEIHSELGAHRERWDELVLEAFPPSPSLRSWWLDGVVQPESRFVLCVEDGRLLGGLAVDMGQRLGHVSMRSIGAALLPNHYDIVYAPPDRSVVESAFRAWFETFDHCTLFLTGVREDSLLATVVPLSLSNTAGGENPYVQVPDDWEAYFSSRSKNLRTSIRKPAIRLEELGYRYRVLERDEVDVGLASWRRLHTEALGSHSRALPNFDLFSRAVRAGVPCGELTFHVIARDDDIIAIDVMCEMGTYALSYQHGRDTRDRRFRGAGTWLQAEVLRSYAERRFQILDLGRGAHDYKLRWADGSYRHRLIKGWWGWRSHVWQAGLRVRDRLRSG